MTFKVAPTLVDCAVVFAVLLWLRLSHRRNNFKLPPGPKGYPLIGNVFDIMVPELWKTAQEWENKYGGIIYMKSVGRPVVLINSYDVAVDLLEKRALNYSDRPFSIMISELQRWDWLFITLPYGETWRRKRTPVQKFSDLTNSGRYEDAQKNEVQKLLRRLQQSPQDFDLHIQTCMASYIMMLTYGHEVNSMDDPFVSLSKRGSEQFQLAIKAGGYLVDFIPWLKYVPKWFPGAEFQTIAEYGAKVSRDMRFLPYFYARDKFFSGPPIPSFLSLQIEERIDAGGKLSEEDEGIISAACGICYSAGADTTSMSLLFFLFAMVLHPEVQTRAQDEIDRIVGGGRLPDFSDRPQLPYCTALCKELQRWNPIVPNGIAHLTKEDDEYAGFFIPAKTMILPNQWAMLMDPKEYPDPHIFRPERFVPTDGGRIQRDPYKIAFGFGRRVCQGAAKTLFSGNNAMGGGGVVKAL